MDKNRIAKDKDKAILYLMENISEETLRDIYNICHNDHFGGNLMEYHHGFGTGVRNLLRDGGFDWGSIELDNEWASLVAEAARRKVEHEDSG